MGRMSYRGMVLFVSIVVGGAIYWLTRAPLLSAVTGVVWGGCLSAFVYVYDQYPSSVSGGGWRSSRWTGVGVWMCTTAAFLGVSPFLGIPDDTRFALQFLVLGAGFGAYVSGILTETERR